VRHLDGVASLKSPPHPQAKPGQTLRCW
jgi:hypothetical protein